MNHYVETAIAVHGYFGALERHLAGWEATSHLWPEGADWRACSQALAEAAQAWGPDDLGLDIWDPHHAQQWADLRALIASAQELT